MTAAVPAAGVDVRFLPPYFNDCSSLLIRHLPPEFNVHDVQMLLKETGAVNIRYFGNSGRLRNIAIADFSSPHIAILVLQKLHQIRLGKRRLVVEFADQHVKKHHPSHMAVTGSEPAAASVPIRLDPFRPAAEMPAASSDSDNVSPLGYQYPSANADSLVNIMFAMAEIKKFYLRVVDLMNQLNLPVPFGPRREAPELLRDDSVLLARATSDTEAETETVEPAGQRSVRYVPVRTAPASRSLNRPKVTSLKEVITDVAQSKSPVSNVFDLNGLPQKRPFVIKPPSEEALERQVAPDASGVPRPLVPSEGGFGTINPPVIVDVSAEVSEEFISDTALQEGRLKPDELGAHTAFKNYSAGRPSAKLYLKNLSKTAEEQDLRFIFGRYVNWNSAADTESFNIRLMQEGRMKGQAFVNLPSQIKAEVARKDVNGYVLHGKPIVAVFARSL